MKTIEMLNVIKPGQKMERIKSKYSYTYGYVSFIDDVLCWDNSRNNPFQIAYDHLEDDEWKLIKEPVDFIIAFQAYKNGHTISCKVNTEYMKSTYYYKYEQHKKTAISTNEMIYGKWYIEN